MKAAIKAKQQNDLEQARQYLRTAKNFDPQIELAKSGKSVDISKVSRDYTQNILFAPWTSQMSSCSHRPKNALKLNVSRVNSVLVKGARLTAPGTADFGFHPQHRHSTAAAVEMPPSLHCDE